MNKKLLQRFDELSSEAEKVASTKFVGKHMRSTAHFVNAALFLSWRVKAEHLLRSACGATSTHVSAFSKAEASGGMLGSNFLAVLNRCQAVFDAARDDYAGGYLTSVEELIRAEVFDHELEQAKQLLSAGYSTAAAVVAGVVLETALRSLCEKHAVEPNGMERMNQDLAKAGAYTVLVQKQITEMAHIRNKAAHGQQEEYTEADVRKMVSNVGDFVAAHVGT